MNLKWVVNQILDCRFFGKARNNSLTSVIGFLFLAWFILQINACKKDQADSGSSLPTNIPVLTTIGVGSITPTTASSGGHITSKGGGDVVYRGVCWNSKGSPTIEDSHTTDGEGTGDFYSDISGLQQGINYFVRAYAINSYGTAYGNEVKFSTIAWVQAPVVTTTVVIGVTVTSAIGGGNVTDAGSSSITACGICWSTGTTPTIQNNKTSESPGTGSFGSQMTNLSANTRYYVRAYATNSNAGISYGSTVSFLTRAGSFSDIDGNVYYYTQIGTQTWMTENLKTTKYNNGDPIPLKQTLAEWNATTTGAYCNYSDTGSFINTYGRIYSWLAVNDPRKICPTGWHVPNDQEWQTLITFLGGDSIAGGKMKEAGALHWFSPNTGATNESGFTALPGGERTMYGLFYDYRSDGNFWSSTLAPYNYVHCWGVYYGDSKVGMADQYYEQWGISVRCIKD